MQVHPALSFALDIADKLIKLVAVILGGIWTYWNYRKSRTYAQKLELEITALIFVRVHTYLEIAVSIKNLGGTAHTLRHAASSSCSIFAIAEDLSERVLRVLPVFAREDHIEPGESIDDLQLVRLDPEDAHAMWVKIALRVASDGVEWHQTKLVRLQEPAATLDGGVTQ